MWVSWRKQFVAYYYIFVTLASLALVYTKFRCVFLRYSLTRQFDVFLLPGMIQNQMTTIPFNILIFYIHVAKPLELKGCNWSVHACLLNEWETVKQEWQKKKKRIKAFQFMQIYEKFLEISVHAVAKQSLVYYYYDLVIISMSLLYSAPWVFHGQSKWRKRNSICCCME